MLTFSPIGHMHSAGTKHVQHMQHTTKDCTVNLSENATQQILELTPSTARADHWQQTCDLSSTVNLVQQMHGAASSYRYS